MSVSEDKAVPIETMLGAIDTQAQRAIKTGQQAVEPLVISEVPRKSGKTATALRPRTSRTATGGAITINAPRGRVHDGQVTIADVVRYVNKGTGLYRNTPGPKKRIRSSRRPPRRMVLPGGVRRWTVKGQHPNEFMERIRVLGTPRVEASFKGGSQLAARAAERVVG